MIMVLINHYHEEKMIERFQMILTRMNNYHFLWRRFIVIVVVMRVMTVILVGIFKCSPRKDLDGNFDDPDDNGHLLLSFREPKRGVSDYHQRRMFAHGYHFIAQQVTHP